MTQIFRTIEVGHGQHLSLGAPIPPDVKQLMHSTAPGQWQMDPGTFGGARSITAFVTPEEAVQRIVFAYAPGTDYQTLLGQFTSELGEPARQHGTERSVWEDPETRFQLFATPGEPSPAVGSELDDLAGGEGQPRQ
jgi:hypothetical protein